MRQGNLARYLNMSDEAVNEIAAKLSELEAGFLPYPIFDQIARLVALPIIEFVPLRTHEGNTQVLLIERDKADNHFGGELHTPGTVIRATDLEKDSGGNWKTFSRILHDELLDTPVGQPHYAGSIFHKSKRGAEQAQIYWIVVTGEPLAGKFYNTDNLPESLIESQIKFIKVATTHYEAKI